MGEVMTVNALREQLENYTGEYAPSWSPQEGDVVCGKIVSYNKANTQYGEAIIAVVNDDKLGETSVWLSSTVLLDQFKRLRPKIGETVGVKYLGKHEEKNYHRYYMTVDRGEEPGGIDWDKAAAPDATAVGEDESAFASGEGTADYDPFAD